jgi:hypothetical protein
MNRLRFESVDSRHRSRRWLECGTQTIGITSFLPSKDRNTNTNEPHSKRPGVLSWIILQG